MLPREKLIKYGVESLENYELLAILLVCGTKEENVFDLSKRIISNISNMKDFINLTYEELILIDGIKEAKAAKIMASIEFAKRIFYEQKENIYLKNPKDIYDFIRLDYIGLNNEILYALYCDKGMRLVYKKKISEGTENNIFIHPKEILSHALKLGISNIIICHNHPAGTLTPSKADIDFTNHLVSMAKIMDLCIIDHLIITESAYYSFTMSKKIE